MGYGYDSDWLFFDDRRLIGIQVYLPKPKDTEKENTDKKENDNAVGILQSESSSN